MYAESPDSRMPTSPSPVAESVASFRNDAFPPAPHAPLRCLTHALPACRCPRWHRHSRECRPPTLRSGDDCQSTGGAQRLGLYVSQERSCCSVPPGPRSPAWPSNVVRPSPRRTGPAVRAERFRERGTAVRTRRQSLGVTPSSQTAAKRSPPTASRARAVSCPVSALRPHLLG